MTAAQRNATRRYRERRRNSGLARLEVQVPADAIPVIRKVASLLRDQTEDAASLRRRLGFEDAPLARSALDIFATEEAPAAASESLLDEALAQVGRNRRDPRFNRARKIKL